MWKTFCKDGKRIDGSNYRPAKSLIRLGPSLINFHRPIELLLKELKWKYTSGKESLNGSNDQTPAIIKISFSVIYYFYFIPDDKKLIQYGFPFDKDYRIGVKIDKMTAVDLIDPQGQVYAVKFTMMVPMKEIIMTRVIIYQKQLVK